MRVAGRPAGQALEFAERGAPAGACAERRHHLGKCFREVIPAWPLPGHVAMVRLHDLFALETRAAYSAWRHAPDDRQSSISPPAGVRHDTATTRVVLIPRNPALECQRALRNASFPIGHRPQYVGCHVCCAVGRGQSGRACAEPPSRPVSPAKRGRSAATRLDGGEHTRTLSVSTAPACHNILWSTVSEKPAHSCARQHSSWGPCGVPVKGPFLPMTRWEKRQTPGPNWDPTHVKKLQCASPHTTN